MKTNPNRGKQRSMLRFYYAPLSVNSRRVWIALLEKQIPFEPILLNLDGDQFSAEFTKINPLQRVPVVIDDGLTLVESLAILEYLEAKYPVISLMPDDVDTIAVIRMICMICLTDLQPSTLPLTKQFVGLTVELNALQIAQQRIIQILQFFEGLDYFTENHFTLADVVAGTLIPSVSMFGIPMESFPKLTAWLERLSSRESFQQTEPSPDQIQAALPNIKKILEMR